jgi:hypothetical protein
MFRKTSLLTVTALVFALLAASPIASAAGTTVAVDGSGAIRNNNIPFFCGLSPAEPFTLAAKGSIGDETATGSMSADSVDLQTCTPFHVEAEVTCLMVTGNEAVAFGPVTSLSPARPPGSFDFNFFAIVIRDNGSTGDVGVLVYSFLQFPPTSCALAFLPGYLPFLGVSPLVSGDVTIAIGDDATPPVLTLPGQISANATDSDGAVVSYTVTATDNVDPNPVVSCLPASGGLFAIGDTRVNCTATDSAGNNATAGFTVHVKGAPEQLTDLEETVIGVGPGTSLASKVKRIQSYLAANDKVNACGTLSAFINDVKAQTGKLIQPGTALPTQAGSLMASAQRIGDVLGC